MVELLLVGKPLFWVGAVGLGVPIGLWGLVFGGISYFFSRLRNRPTDEVQKIQDPLMILKNRFVLGEITEEEFKRMKKEL